MKIYLNEYCETIFHYNFHSGHPFGNTKMAFIFGGTERMTIWSFFQPPSAWISQLLPFWWGNHAILHLDYHLNPSRPHQCLPLPASSSSALPKRRSKPSTYQKSLLTKGCLLDRGRVSLCHIEFFLYHPQLLMYFVVGNIPLSFYLRIVWQVF